MIIKIKDKSLDNILIVCINDFDSALKMVKKFFNEDIDLKAPDPFTAVSDNMAIVSVVSNDKDKIIKYVVHELYHVVSKFSKIKGFCEETGAYMIDYYFGEIYKELNKLK